MITFGEKIGGAAYGSGFSDEVKLDEHKKIA